MVVYNEFKGYSLFFDVPNFSVRASHRGTVMANMLEDMSENLEKGFSHYAVEMVKYYLENIPELERELSISFMKKTLMDRGYKSEEKLN